MSFTIDKHFCGETLIDVSYIGKAKSCGMKMNTAQKDTAKKKCCKNETEVIKASTFDKEKIISFSAKNLEFVAHYIYSYINLYQEAYPEKEYFKDFSPPDLKRDTQTLFQTFLI